MVKKSIRKRWRSAAKGHRHYGIANRVVKKKKQVDDIHHDQEIILPVPRPLEVERRSVKVLSLFDGISSGLCALKELNIDVQQYYSSEIDKNALQVQNCNFFGEVIPLGSVTCITQKTLENLGDINLLLGGSPCQELSLVNHAQKGLNDPTASGVLFYDYVRILRYLQSESQRQNFQFFWLFENTCNMKIEFKQTISRFLKCEPIKICASTFVPMIRERNYWTNIPQDGFRQHLPVKPLQSFLNPGRLANVSIVSTITSNMETLRKGCKLPVSENGSDCGLLVVEAERLFGFKDGHTIGHDLCKTTRLKLIGNSWCIPVIKSILGSLPKMSSS